MGMESLSAISGMRTSGFAFIALCLPWLNAPAGAERRRAIGLRWLAAVVCVGLLAGAVQTLRGAHFPSHTLWTLLICTTVSLVGWRLMLTRLDLPRVAGAAPQEE